MLKIAFWRVFEASFSLYALQKEKVPRKIWPIRVFSHTFFVYTPSTAKSGNFLQISSGHVTCVTVVLSDMIIFPCDFTVCVKQSNNVLFSSKNLCYFIFLKCNTFVKNSLRNAYSFVCWLIK